MRLGIKVASGSLSVCTNRRGLAYSRPLEAMLNGCRRCSVVEGRSRLAMVRCCAAVAAAMLSLCACSDLDFDRAAEPVVAGIDSPDTELAEFLKELIGQARVMPKSGAMRGRLAMAYGVNGFPDAALAAYQHAESLDPSDFRWPYFRALLLAQEGDHGGALLGLERAIAIDADYAPAWLWRGTWLLESNRLEEAALAFERAGDLGDGADASFGRAQVLMAQGRHAEAVALLEPYARESRHPHVFRTLGQALRAMGRIEEARLAMARARDAIPFSWQDERRDQLGSYLYGVAPVLRRPKSCPKRAESPRRWRYWKGWPSETRKNSAGVRQTFSSLAACSTP